MYKFKSKKEYFRKKCYYEWDNNMNYNEKEYWIRKDAEFLKVEMDKDEAEAYKWFCEGAREVYPFYGGVVDTLRENGALKDAAYLLFDQAKMVEGELPLDISLFNKRISKFMGLALK